MNAKTMESQDSAQLDSEQLLKMLDLQLIAVRQRREGKETSRMGFRVFSIAAILFLLMGALWVAMYLLEEMRPAKDQGPGPEGFVEVVQ